MQTKPRTQQRSLIVRELEEEILIYNTETNNAHCLNRTAALIWKECNGQSTVPEISNNLSRRLGTNIDEQVVWFALKQFDRDGLLENKLILPVDLVRLGLNRRQVMKALGLAAIVAVPLVTSIVAPTAVQAGLSCLPTGSVCTSPAQCCSGLCSPIAGAPSACQ
jgi:hypothetical protein